MLVVRLVLTTLMGLGIEREAVFVESVSGLFLSCIHTVVGSFIVRVETLRTIRSTTAEHI